MPRTTGREQRSPLSPARQRLAARYLPLARALARPLKQSWPQARDEFESAACLALVEAAEAFDPGPEGQVRYLRHLPHPGGPPRRPAVDGPPRLAVRRRRKRRRPSC